MGKVGYTIFGVLAAVGMLSALLPDRQGVALGEILGVGALCAAAIYLPYRLWRQGRRRD